MNARVQGARRVQGAVLGAVALVAAPWAGWWLAILVVLALSVLVVLDRLMATDPNPQRASMAALVELDLLLAVAAGGTGGARSPLAGWLLVPTIMFACRFRPRVVMVGFGATGLLAGTEFAVAAMLPKPPTLPLAVAALAWAGLAVGVLAAVMALLRAELRSRDEAVVDPLTGLYNRSALVGRFNQAAAQVQVLQESLSLVMCDIDHFKDVNDRHGHDVGDEVLRQVATQMRVTLRSFDLVYRFGGEEFLILLPGQDLAAAQAIADRLRAAVAALVFPGFGVTLSAGVSSARGSNLVFDAMLHDADRALYQAKSNGRNQVVVHAL